MNAKTTLVSAAILLAAVTATACGGEAAPEGRGAGTPTGRAAAHDESGSAALALSDEQIRNGGLELAQAGPAAIRETLSLYGTIVPNAERVRDVTARFPGAIQSVAAKVGDTVRAGETLATVESNESLRTYAVTAPIAGTVTKREANPGEQSADKVLFTIADLSSVWVELSLFPRDVAKVRVGQTVRVRSADAGLDGEGRIVYVAPIGSSASQTVTARVQLGNEARRWAPGLYVTADVTLSEQPAAVTVQNTALQTVEERTVVFVRSDHGFVPRTLRLGRRDPLRSEVLEGLVAGEAYVAGNSFVLKAELGKGEAGHGH